MGTNEHDLAADALEQSIADHPITLGAPEALDFGEEHPMNTRVNQPGFDRVSKQFQARVARTLGLERRAHFYRQVQALDATPTCQPTMHMAVALMADDPASALTDAQRHSLRQRCKQRRNKKGTLQSWMPFSEQECRALAPLLLAWSIGKAAEAVLYIHEHERGAREWSSQP